MLMKLGGIITILVGLTFVFFACSIPENKRPRISSKAAALLEDGPITGLTLGLHSKDFTYDYEWLLKEVKATGSPWVCLTVKFYIENNIASHINIPPVEDPFWTQLEKTSSQAKALGFKVIIFPIVLIKKPRYKEWRGTLRPASSKLWFESYECMMTHVGQIATRTKADMLSVGSEFCSLERYKEKWFNVIETVKQSYKGALTYSANWDAIQNIEFHDQLDFLGLTGYFDLTRKKDPTVAELISAWKPIVAQFKQWQTQKNIPLIFTELGYTSQDGTNTHPWNYHFPNVLDLQEQKDCYTAFTEVWRNEEALYGVFFYDWFGIGGKEDFGYTPKGKPALEVVKKWF